MNNRLDATTFAVVAAIVLAVYGLSFVIVCHNTIKYIVMDKRVTKEHTQLIAFYVNAALVILLRIVQFSLSCAEQN